MALNHITFYSKLMEMEMGIDVIIPENKWGYSLAERPKDYKYPVLWLLCGGGFDYTDWQRYTAIELYAAQAGIAVVMPSAYYSGYMDTIHGDYKYFSVITDEISKLAVKLFPLSEKREDNFVAGIAMGGNGSLALGLKRPDLYAACVDLSGGIGCSVDTDAFIDEVRTLKMERLQSTFGNPDKLRDGQYDLGGYARRAVENGTKLPDIYIAVGENDFIRDVVRKDRDALISSGIPIHYEEVKGYTHDWNFWDPYLKKALSEWLPLKREPIYLQG